MLLSVLIPITSTFTLEEKSFLGREAHAFFLRLVENADPDLSNELHSENDVKPFTVSGILSEQNHPQAATEIIAGQRYFIRLSSIEERLSQLLCEHILPRLPDTIQLGEATFQVGSPLTGEKPLAESISVEELVDKHFSQSRPRREIGFEFLSPTAFKRSGRNLVVPLPSLLFRSYLNSWNSYCHPKFDGDFLGLVEESVQISRFNLRTVLLPFQNHKEIGFIGQCCYTVFNTEPALWRLLNILADFAFYCGTGAKTTMGMGQTRRASWGSRTTKQGHSTLKTE